MSPVRAEIRRTKRDNYFLLEWEVLENRALAFFFYRAGMTHIP